MIDDVMKVKITSRQSVLSPCSDLSTNKSLNLTISYIGDQCKNTIVFHCRKNRHIDMHFTAKCKINYVYALADILGMLQVGSPLETVCNC